MNRVYVPTREQVANELKHYRRYLNRQAIEEGCVRLRVTDDAWRLYTGDSSFDRGTDGHLGKDTVLRCSTEADLQTVADHLIEQVMTSILRVAARSTT